MEFFQRIYFLPNVAAERREELCNVVKFQSTPNLGKYMEFLLKLPGSTSQDFNFVIERVQSKLAGWKGHLLSFAGRLVQTKSVLAAVPSYVMQGVMLLVRLLNSVDRVCGNFIWRSTEEKRKLHMVGWDKITRPKGEGGLGVPAARPRNLALTAKLGWRLKNEKEKSWAKILTISIKIQQIVL